MGHPEDTFGLVKVKVLQSYFLVYIFLWEVRCKPQPVIFEQL